MQASVGRVLLIVGLQFATSQLLVAVVSSRLLQQDDFGLNIDVNVIGGQVIDENHYVIDYRLKNTAAISPDYRIPLNVYDYPSDSSRSFTDLENESLDRRSKSASSSIASHVDQDSTASYGRGAFGIAGNIEEKQYGGDFNGETNAETGQYHLLSIYPLLQQQQQQQQSQQQLPLSQYYPQQQQQQQQQIDGVAAVGAAALQDLYFNPPAVRLPYPFYHTSSTMAPTTTTTTTTTTMATTTTRASDDSSSDDSAERKKKRKHRRVRPSVIIVKKVLPLSTSTYSSG